ncbi:MmcQ/YjbR family DNA-binding protein [Caulobacter sp. 17J80-11]|uniref:MmcQ/YjbR family DNA-binding protein n=1 Tax=Caulobacter sp. 17J80-11 TaxID=2763502 RepID=UPI001653A30C|nr:MmcQ/YjbR family DNA-binding protein [Caulobacter sp. 17J80-11]MBC6981048.1 MmcQ/YjbR family DNA-binding protein [Caulobacter sp. 17J80-11]
MTWEEVRGLARALPGVEDGTSYGTPALKVGGRLLVRLREDGATVVLQDIGFDEREALIESRPDVFHFTDHYRDYPCVLARLTAAGPDALRGLIERSWRARAPKRVVAAWERDRP